MPACAVVTVRWRTCVPPPHAAEHAAHAPHVLTWQSCAHTCVLHDIVSLSGGQSLADAST